MTKRKKVWIHPKARLFFLWCIIVAVVVVTGVMWKGAFQRQNQVIGGEEYGEMRRPKKMFAFDQCETIYWEMRQRELEERRSLGHQAYFAKDLFVGDSITQGLLYYHYLEENQVYAVIGMSLQSAMGHVDEMVAREPKTMYIMLGMNDLDNGLSPEAFKKTYGKLIDQLREALPKTKIVIQSITPVQKKVYDSHPHITEERISQYNDALKSLAEEKDVSYMSLTRLFENEEVFEEDGLHVVYSFYNDYLNDIRAWEEESIER